MIVLKTQSELKTMMKAMRISAETLNIAEETIREGITTKELDKAMYDFIIRSGAKPSFLGLYGFPATACISVNDVVIHGIPDDTRLKYGDIVSVDVGAYCDGFHGDNAYTFIVGDTSEENKKLLRETEAALYKGIEQAVVGNRVGDISHAIEQSMSPSSATGSSGSSSATALAARCMRTPKCRTSAARATVPGSSRG